MALSAAATSFSLILYQKSGNINTSKDTTRHRQMPGGTPKKRDESYTVVSSDRSVEVPP